MVGRVGVAWHPPAVVGARAPHAALARRRVGGAGWSEPGTGSGGGVCRCWVGGGAGVAWV